MLSLVWFKKVRFGPKRYNKKKPHLYCIKAGPINFTLIIINAKETCEAIRYIDEYKMNGWIGT